MSSFSFLRSKLRSTFYSSDVTDSSFGTMRREAFPILSRNLSSYERFDVSAANHATSTTSSQHADSKQNSLANTPIIETRNDSVEFTPNSSKRTLRTLPGVFCPVALSMFSIALFMRMGFVLGHAGVLQTLLQFGLCFTILFCTLLSVCSLATNGAIEGGGVYHMISRTLGPEFGGSIGVLFYFANVLANGLSVAALVEAIVVSFGPGSKLKIFYINKTKSIYFFVLFFVRQIKLFTQFTLVEIFLWNNN